MAGRNDESSARPGDANPAGEERLPGALGDLERVMLAACAAQDPWPAQIAAGVYAGIDFIIANHGLAQAWLAEVGANPAYGSEYEHVVDRLASFIRMRAPVGARLPASTDEALVAGIIGLVGDHVRIGRLDRLAELRPELVQLTLLPYLGFVESQRWANRSAGVDEEEA
ncbi:MAG: hypothetical protein ACOYD4_08765 [Solirubrobacterales bacterium]